MAYRDDEISGMRGWLLFFFLALAVIQPLLLVWRLLISVGEAGDMFPQSTWPIYVMALRILFIAVIVASWLLAARLWFVRNWRTIRIVIAGIWTINLGTVLFDLAAMILLLGVDAATVLGAALFALVRSTLYCALWTSYLLRSRRAANPYHRHGDPLAAVFD